MDRSKLPLSLLVALGLAPGACTNKDGRAHPCLSPPIDDSKPQPDTKDPPVGPCLKVAPPEVGPCLEVPPEPERTPCLSPPMDRPPPGPTKEDPPIGPCLKVRAPDPPVHPCLSMPNPKAVPPPGKAKAPGGMASRSRSEVIERVRAALPADVAARLLADDSEDA